MMDLAQPAEVRLIPTRLDDRPAQRLMVVLRAPGCQYALRTGGCTNCGFHHLTTRGVPVPSEQLIAQLQYALDHLTDPPEAIMELDLYCSGSFFCDEEIPPAARHGLLQLTRRLPRLRTVLLDSRPEYVTAEVLRATGRSLGLADNSIRLEVAIGLESADDTIRLRHIRKGFSLQSFEAAAKNLADAGAALAVYLLLKPLGVDEEAAIADVLASGRYLADLAQRLHLPTRVALEPLFVVEGTPLFEELRAGRYTPPSLWSVVQAIYGLEDLLPVQVGLDTEGLPAQNVPAGCWECSAPLREALARYNITQDKTVLERVTCRCQPSSPES
jgi:archaeosine synthase beta-subunit